MSKRDFSKALAEAAEALDAQMPDAADRRLRARLNGTSPRRPRPVRWARVGGLCFAAAALVAIALTGWRQLSPADPMLGGFAVTSPSADWKARAFADDAVEVAAGRSLLNDRRLGAVLSVSGAVRVRRLADGVEVMAGPVELEVDPAAPRSSAYRVRVSHGSIEVLGTHFTVAQQSDGGTVTLHRGSIRFRADDGQGVLLTPGQSLRWPLPPVVPQPPAAPAPAPAPALPRLPPAKPAAIAAPAPGPIPAAPAPVPTVEKLFDPEKMLNRIATLRSRGQYEEAVAALSAELGKTHPASTQERLSFELGAILSRQLSDKPRACEHWQRHLEQFPKGRYDREVAQARAQLGCPD